jgi:hypothetical protein
MVSIDHLRLDGTFRRLMRPLNRQWFAALASALVVAVLVVGCSPDGPSARPLESPPTSTPSSIATAAASAQSPQPTATSIPGFADWELINPGAVRLSVEDEALVMELTRSVLWFNDQTGVLFSREVTGDFRATATVRTSKASDPSVPPGGDGTIQLAGLMARASGEAENSVFIVSGSIGSSTGLETKTTESSHSIYIQRAQPTGGDAQLQLCRKGSTFYLWWRHVDSTEDWTHMSTLDRKDMPDTLQVGANMYTNARPDLVARFEGLSIAPLAPTEAC